VRLALAIEDAGDHGVGVVRGEAADEREAVLVGPDPRWIRAGQTDLEFSDGAPTPAQREARAAFVTVDSHGHILQQRPQELLFVARRGRGRGPHASDIVTERAEALGVGRAEGLPVVALAEVKFALGLLQVPETLLPLGFQATGHEAILGLDRAIAAFGAVGVIPRSLDGEAPLRERRIVVGVELRRRHERGVQGGGG
jgi:hypothetical protein